MPHTSDAEVTAVEHAFPQLMQEQLIGPSGSSEDLHLPFPAFPKEQQEPFPLSQGSDRERVSESSDQAWRCDSLRRRMAGVPLWWK